MVLHGKAEAISALGLPAGIAVLVEQRVAVDRASAGSHFGNDRGPQRTQNADDGVLSLPQRRGELLLVTRRAVDGRDRPDFAALEIERDYERPSKPQGDDFFHQDGINLVGAFGGEQPERGPPSFRYQAAFNLRDKLWCAHFRSCCHAARPFGHSQSLICEWWPSGGAWWSRPLPEPKFLPSTADAKPARPARRRLHISNTYR